MRLMRRSVRPHSHGLGSQRRDVARAVADHRHGLLAQGRQDQLAFLAVGARLAGLEIDDLGVEVILEDVRPGLALAFHRHARADDFRQPVDVVGLDAAVGLDAPAHGFGPRLGAEDAGAQRQFLDVHAQLRRLVNQVQEIAGRAADGRDTEILHHHQLALGVAAGDRDDRRAQRLGAVMRPQPAGEQAVAVGVLDDVPLMQPAGGEAAQHDVGPDLDVLLRVGDDDGFAGRAAGGVQAHDLLHRAGEQAERIGVPQVGLARERQLGQILQRLHVLRRHPPFLHPFAEQGDVIVGALHDGLEPLQLQRPAVAAAAENPAR